MGQMLSVDEAAKVMGVHPKTITRMIGRGELDATRVGRVWRIAPGTINALTGQVMVKNGEGGADLDPARRLAVSVLSDVLPIFKGYCERTGKEISELTADDLRQMLR
jgi:excisionase family DNA binding protein